MFYSVLSLVGVVSYFNMPVDLMPASDSSVLTVFIGIRGGLPPEDIESLVTKPVEDEMATLPNLQDIISVSRKERAVITLTFRTGTDSSRAALEVQERLAKIKGKLPKDVEKPIVSRYDENQSPIVILAMSSKKYTPEQLRDIADNQMKPVIKRLEGVANIEIGGGRERKILVEFDQNRLEAQKIPIRQVISQIGLDNLNILMGKMQRERDSYLVRTVGAFKTLEDVGELPIAVTKEGSRIRLKDIAEIRDFYLEPESYSRLNREPVVSAYIQKEALGNTIATAKRIKAMTETFRKTLDPEINFSIVSDQSVAIEKALNDVKHALFEGAFLAGVILILFLRDILSASIIFTSIPLSFIITLAIMKISNLSLNVMTISGLALASGMVVDDSIVVLENIVHRRKKRESLIHQRAQGEGREVSERIEVPPEKESDPGLQGEFALTHQSLPVEATGEMILALTASTLTKVIVFLPILFLNPEVKMLYSGLAITVTSALLVSLLVSVTVIPSVSANLSPVWMKESAYFSTYFWLFTRTQFGRIETRFGRWIPNLERFFSKLKDKIFKRPNEDIVITAGRQNLFKIRKGFQNYRRVMRWFADWRDAVILVALLWAGMTGASMIFWKKVASWLLGLWAVPVVFICLVLLQSGFRGYRNFVSMIMRKRYWVAGILLFFLLGCVQLYRHLDKEFVGTTEENEFTIFVELPSGAKLDLSDKVVTSVEKILSETPEVKKSVKTSVARVEGWSSKIYVTLLPIAERKRSTHDVIATLRPLIAKVGQEYNGFVYFSEPSSSKEFIIDVFGYDYLKLKSIAVQIAQILEKVPGLLDIKLRYKEGQPEVRIEVDRQRASGFDMTVQEIAENLHAQIRGLRATYFLTPTAQIETVARLQEYYRKTLEDVEALAFINSQGAIVQVRQVALFQFGLTPSEIWRKNRERMIQVSANRGDVALSKVAEETNKSLRHVQIPIGYYYELGGDFPKMMETEKESRFAFLIMILLVYSVLASLFESFSQPLIILVAVPLTLIGAIPLLFITDTPVTLGTLIGLIMLGGISVSNSIILVDVFNNIRKKTNVLRALLQAGEERFRPILMTTLTTTLGLVPLLVNREESGSLWAPLATTVIGGLIVSTVLVLFVLPGFYLILEDAKGWFGRKFFSLAAVSPPPQK